MTVRRDAERDETLIFLHIYKTAGTTLRKIIERNYDPSTVYTVDLDERKTFCRFKELTGEDRKRFAVLQGHVRFGLHKLVPGPATYVTMLRDPIDRVLSDYYFILREPIHHLYERVVSERMTLRDYVRSQMSLSVDNGQIRVLCGEPDVAYGHCSRAMLEEAKHNLESHFSVAGLTERFDESILLMKRAFGWKMPLYVRHNVTRNRPSREHLEKDVLELIQEHNALDIELYRFVLNRLNESLAEQSSSFQADLWAFRCANAVYGRTYPCYRSLRHGARRILAFCGLEESVRSRFGRNGKDP